jgi:DUF4097 and DUF4098 domain-containing protein YvlB
MEKVFPTRGKVSVFVENQVGLVVLTAHAAEDTRVSLEPDTAGATEFVNGAVVECRTSRGRDHVIVKVPRLRGMKFIRRNGVTVRIEAPSGSDVTVASASAPVELNGSFGAVDVKTASGDVTADDVNELEVKTASGDTEAGVVAGDLRLHSASGDLRCVRVNGRVSVRTASGELEIGSVADQIDVKGSSGDVRLGDVVGDLSIASASGDIHVLSIARGRAQLRSASGSVEVGVARGVALQVDAASVSGSVHSDIALSDVPEGAPGQGGDKVVLTARTISGNILVTRAADAFTR